MRPDAATGYPGRTHRFYTGTPLWSFGTGLSYTTFARAIKCNGGSGAGTAVDAVSGDCTLTVPLPVGRSSGGAGGGGAGGGGGGAGGGGPVSDTDVGPWSDTNDDVILSVDTTVTNVGGVAGDDVVLLYLEPPPGAVANGAPKQQLAAFARVSVATNETKVVRLDLLRRHFRVPAAAQSAAASSPWKVQLNGDSANGVWVAFDL